MKCTVINKPATGIKAGNISGGDYYQKYIAQQYQPLQVLHTVNIGNRLVSVFISDTGLFKIKLDYTKNILRKALYLY